MEEKFYALLAQLQRLQRPVVDWINPGITPDQVAALGPLPQDVETWFSLHNGIAHHPGQELWDVNVIPGYSPHGLAEAVAHRKVAFPDPVLWQMWLPLLHDHSDGFYAAVWSDSASAPVVMEYLVGFDTAVAFASISDMLDAAVDCYVQGVFFVNAEGGLDANYEQAGALGWGA